MATLVARLGEQDDQTGRVLQRTGPARVPHHIVEHELLQQQELVAAVKQHRSGEGAPVVHIRAAKRRVQRRKGPRAGPHTAGAPGLFESLESELLRHNIQVNAKGIRPFLFSFAVRTISRARTHPSIRTGVLNN